MTTGHDIEQGHFCPSCNAHSICLIEDGACDMQGRCDNCIRQDAFDRFDRMDRDGDPY